MKKGSFNQNIFDSTNVVTMGKSCSANETIPSVNSKAYDRKAKCDDNAAGISRFRPTVTVLGRLFHLIGPSQPLPELPLSFMTIYFHDSDYT